MLQSEASEAYRSGSPSTMRLLAMPRGGRSSANGFCGLPRGRAAQGLLFPCVNARQRFWSGVIARFEKSEMSRREFAAEAGVGLAIFQYWLYKLRRSPGAARRSPEGTLRTRPPPLRRCAPRGPDDVTGGACSVPRRHACTTFIRGPCGTDIGTSFESRVRCFEPSLKSAREVSHEAASNGPLSGVFCLAGFRGDVNVVFATR